MRAVEEELVRQQEALRRAQAEAFGAAQDLSRVRNELNALDLQKQGNSIRLEKLSAEKLQLEEERTRLEARLQEFTASVEVEKLNAQTKRGSVEQRHNRLRELQGELQASAAVSERHLERSAGLIALARERMRTRHLALRSLDEAFERDGHLTVILDLAQLTFIDSTGIALLLREKQAARKDGERLRIRGGSGRAVRRTLELAGVDSLLRDG